VGDGLSGIYCRRRVIAWFVFGSVMVFLAILVLGYIVEWKNGALDWE
jgi:NADH:ubiquinone oxidoreductase subunit 3 (subunit A)